MRTFRGTKIVFFCNFLDIGYAKFLIILLWGPIGPIGTICIRKGWAYGPIPSPRIRGYSRTTSKVRNENYALGKGKEYLSRT